MRVCQISRHWHSLSAIFHCGVGQIRTQQVPVERRDLSPQRRHQRPRHLQVRLSVQNSARGSPRRRNQQRQGSPYHSALDTARELDGQQRSQRTRKNHPRTDSITHSIPAYKAPTLPNPFPLLHIPRPISLKISMLFCVVFRFCRRSGSSYANDEDIKEKNPPAAKPNKCFRTDIADTKVDVPRTPAMVVFPTHDSIPAVMLSWYFLTCIMLARSSSVIPGGRGSFPAGKRGANRGFCIVGNLAVTRMSMSSGCRGTKFARVTVRNGPLPVSGRQSR